MKRNASKILDFLKRHGPFAAGTVLFLACLSGAVGGKWFSEAEIYNAAMTPLADGGFEFSRRGVWLAEGSVGLSHKRMTLTAWERTQWFRRPGDPPGVWT